MKITDSEIIKNGEKGLIEKVTSDLNWQIVEDILRTKYNLQLSGDSIDYKSGDIVVHNNQVAYRLDFDVRVALSVLFNRQGECVDVDVVRTGTEEASSAASDVSGDSGVPAEDVDQKGTTDASDQDLQSQVEAGDTAAASLAAGASPTPAQVADMIASINRD